MIYKERVIIIIIHFILKAEFPIKYSKPCTRLIARQ